MEARPGSGQLGFKICINSLARDIAVPASRCSCFLQNEIFPRAPFSKSTIARSMRSQRRRMDSAQAVVSPSRHQTIAVLFADHGIGGQPQCARAIAARQVRGPAKCHFVADWRGLD